MNKVVNVAFALLWSGALFFLIEYAARRYFAIAKQRTLVASVGAVAFLVGGLASPLRHSTPPGGGSLAPIAPTATPGPHDVSSLCRAQPTGGLATTAIGSLDGVNDTIDRTAIPKGGAVPAGHGVTFAGWAVASDRVTAGVCLDVDRKILGDAHVIYGRLRPDVADVYKNPSFGESGFEIALPTDSLSAGKHIIRVIVVAGDGTLSALKDERTLAVR